MSGLDFGITGKKAIVCASSKGLGFGCANALAAVGATVFTRILRFCPSIARACVMP